MDHVNYHIYGKDSPKNPCLFSKYLYIRYVVLKLRLIWANPEDKRPICKSVFVCQRSNLELPSCLCKIVWVWGLFFTGIGIIQDQEKRYLF